MRLFKSLPVVAVVLLATIGSGLAQVDQSLETGLKPYGSFHGGDLDSINLTNGNLTLHIPLTSYPQRGALGYTPRIVYNNKGWSVVPNCNAVTGACSPYWTYVNRVGTLNGLALDTSPEDFLNITWNFPKPNQTQVFYASTFEGASHQFVPNQAGGWSTIDGTALWYDGSHAANLQPGFSRDRRGNRITGGNMEDANGNFFPSQIPVIDTLGRSFPTTPTNSDNSGCTGPLPTGGQTYTMPGFGGAATKIFKVCSASITISSNFQASGYYNNNLTAITDRSYTVTVVQSIVMYNGSSWTTSPAWTFEYNSRDAGDPSTVNYGDLTKITLPTGGTITYTWGMVESCDPNSPTPVSRGVTSRTVDANDGTGPHTWTYSGAAVHGPDGNDTLHVFTALNGSCSYYETQTKYYQGTYTSGQLLKTVNTDYRWIANPFDLYVGTGTYHSAINVFPIRYTTVWPSGQVSKIEKDYDSSLVFMSPSTGWTTASYGLVTEEREYGFGNGAAGPLVRRTDYTYKAFDGSTNSASYLGLNMLDLVSSVTTYDGSGTMVAKTLYGYDEYALQPSGLGPAQQLDTSSIGNIRGNRTSESHWLNTTNGYVTSTVTYYDSGTPYQTTDPLGHVTTNSYGTGYVSGQNYAGAYVTQVQNAITPAQNTYFDYDFSTGLRTRFKDSNGQETIWTYDNLNRTTSITRPDNGSTIWTYNDAQPSSFTVQTRVLSSVFRTSEADLDGLGRIVHSKLTSDPEGTDTVDTTYDQVGAVQTVSNPHRAASWPTDGTTTSAHDALGRATQVTRQDGSIAYTDYSQFPTITTKDEAGNLRGTRTDAFGRLVEVDEPGNPSSYVANNYANLATDGNFAVFGPANDIKWQTNTHGATNTVYGINVQDDGNVIKYTPTWGSTLPTTTGTATYGSWGCIGYKIFTNQTLASGQCLQSPNNRFILVMQTPGNLVLYDASYSPAVPIFYSGTTGVPGSHAIMQSDGNLVVYTPSNTAYWSTGTVTGTASYMLQLQDQGNLVIYKDIWETSTVQSPNNGSLSSISCSIQGNTLGMGSSLLMGSCLTSPSGRFALNMQTDGNLVLYDRTSNPPSALWSTVTQLTPLDPIVAMKTLYFYDALSNLYCVEQHGTAASGTACPSTPPSPTTPVSPDPNNAWRRRMFGYDSLSRLLWASNPESGIIQYLYDADGNLLQKTSPAPNQTGSATQSISYCYDALHRVTKKDYQAHTFNPPACPITAPVVTYTYDGQGNGVGRLTSLTDQAGSGTYTYDPMGRIKTETRVINGISRAITYDYNFDGSLSALHYPSNRVVNYTVNAGSRVTAATDGNGTQYVVNATSYPPGAEYQRSMPGIYFRTDMNPRLQVSGFYSDDGNTTSRYMNKSYNYGALHQNNGNVVSIINNKDSNRTQSFTYDPLNRITAGWTNANTGTLSWGENYTIDAWGNLQIGQMAGKAHGGYLPNASTAQNQMTGMWYDAPGNMTGYTAPNQYFYDSENRIQMAGGMTYTYDSEGNRVEKASGSTGTLYWHSSVGVIAETDLTGATKSEYVFFGGKRVARIDSPGNSLHYYLSDHLNSTSMIVSASGSVEEESDYSPFGSEYVVTAGPNHYKFTGKERDIETGLDYFGLRYYLGTVGRFLSADPGPMHLENPQTLNRYTYVLNNPVNLIDPDGADSMSPHLKIGSGWVEIYLQDVGVSNTDAAGALNALYDVKVFPYLKSTGIGQSPFFSGEKRSVNVPADGADALGGCLWGCAYGYLGNTTGVDIDITFTHGKGGDGPVDGVMITLTNNGAQFIGEDRVGAISFLPGGTTPPPNANFYIDPNMLHGLSEAELNALNKEAFNAAPNPVRAKLYLAIREAIADERARREAAKKKAEKKKKKKEKEQSRK